MLEDPQSSNGRARVSKDEAAIPSHASRRRAIAR